VESYLLIALQFMHLSLELLLHGSRKKLHTYLISKFIDALFSYRR